jgi:hypothetical protein
MQGFRINQPGTVVLLAFLALKQLENAVCAADSTA